MIYCFEQFELDTDKIELRARGVPVAVEPQVFALIEFLIEQRERMVSKDEIIAHVWDGRIVSDSAIASRIKSARHALADDGSAQRLIRTIHGMGFRFVGAVETAAPPSPIIVTARQAPEPEAMPESPSARPSIAVLPFRHLGDHGSLATIADALPDDLITELARLRWLFVIARGSTFRFRDAQTDIDQVRTSLNVRYCLSGAVEIMGGALTVSVELSDTQTKGVIWGDRFRGELGAVHEIRETIVRAVISALELQIPMNEARRAGLKPPEQLDAWEAYHLGLQHMYRFNKTDNERATGFFQRAATLEPGFARAYAGLSFTHFQNSFLRYADDVDEESKLAQMFAEKAMEHDPIDPFSNFTMGRAFLLRGDLDGSMPWLDRANLLSPNYAQAKYQRAWPAALMGQRLQSMADIDEALALSPLDPMVYAMLGIRSFTYLALSEYAQAAHWADRAARSPGAHAFIDMIATACHGLNGDEERARLWAASAHSRAPNLTKEDFMRVFPFREPERGRIATTLTRFGF